MSEILFPSRSETTTICSSFQVILVCSRSFPPTVTLVVMIFSPRWSVLVQDSVTPSAEEILDS